MQWTIGRKLACGFTMSIALILLVATIANVELREVTGAQAEVLKVHQEAIDASRGVREGMRRSQAGLRGYMATGDESQKLAREEGRRQIDENLRRLRSASMHLDATETAQLDDIAALLAELDQVESDVEEICRRDDNLPATKMLFAKASPLGDAMLKSLDQMIQIENTLEKSPQRRELLSDLTTSKATLIGGLIAIHKFMTTVDPRQQDEFQRHWRDNSERFDALQAKAWLLTPEQSEQFDSYKQNRARVGKMPERLFAMRASDDWNIAQAWLTRESAPRQAQAEQLLAGIISRREQMVQEGRSESAAKASFATATVLATAAFSSIFVALMGFGIVRRISRRMAMTVDVLERAADGDLSQRLPVVGRDELTRMAVAINSVLESTSRLMPYVVDLRMDPSTPLLPAEMQPGRSDQHESQLQELRATIRQMTESAARLNENARTVVSQSARAAEESASAAETPREDEARQEDVVELAEFSREAMAPMASGEEHAADDDESVDGALQLEETDAMELIQQSVESLQATTSEIAHATAEQARRTDEPAAAGNWDFAGQTERIASSSEKLGAQAAQLHALLDSLAGNPSSSQTSATRGGDDSQGSAPHQGAPRDASRMAPKGTMAGAGEEIVTIS